MGTCRSAKDCSTDSSSAVNFTISLLQLSFLFDSLIPLCSSGFFIALQVSLIKFDKSVIRLEFEYLAYCAGIFCITVGSLGVDIRKNACVFCSLGFQSCNQFIQIDSDRSSKTFNWDTFLYYRSIFKFNSMSKKVKDSSPKL